MIRFRIILTGLLMLAAAAPSITLGQGRPDPAVMIAAQLEAMKHFAMMDGEWRGTAWSLSPTGEKTHLIQTERVGPFLDGSVKVIEGRGYEGDGSVAFNALGIISFDPNTKKYSMHSYARGFSGDFVITPTADGFYWEIPAGPRTIRYTAVLSDSTWNEVGDMIMEGTEPVRILEMTLTRLGDTSWPAGGAVSPE